VLADLETENLDFLHKFQVKATEKKGLREQLSEVEHLVRQLRQEITGVGVENQRIQITSEKEDALIEQKVSLEKKAVALVGTDMKE